jgi:hypothetical protein
VATPDYTRNPTWQNNVTPITDDKLEKYEEQLEALTEGLQFVEENGVPGGGAAGASVLNGAGAPGSLIGSNGDFYIDTVADAIYGPKASGAWGSPTSLVGPSGTSGRTILNGTTAPGGSTGVDGDFYIDLTAAALYGPKSGGVWGGSISLIGGDTFGPVDAGALNVTDYVYMDGIADVELTAASEYYPAYIAGAVHARLTCDVEIAGPAGMEIRGQYSVTGGASWNYLTPTGAGPAISVATTGQKDSGWVDIDEDARTSVLLRFVTINGNGVTPTTVNRVSLQVRNPNTSINASAFDSTSHEGLTGVLQVNPASTGTARNKHVSDADLNDRPTLSEVETILDDMPVQGAPVNSVAALRALGGDDLSGVVYMSGHSSAGDGGHGWWRYDSTSTATDNTGLVVKPTSIAVGSAGRWLRIYDDRVSVKWFGAKGDSTKPTSLNLYPNDGTDDTAAFQAAIDSIAGQEKTVFVPTLPITKAYKLTNTLTLYEASRIQGEALQAGQSPELVFYTADDKHGFQSNLPTTSSYPSRIYVRGLRIRHGSAGAAKTNRGLSLERVANGYHVENCIISGFRDGIYVGSTQSAPIGIGDRGRLEDVWIIAPQRYGIMAQRLDNDHIWTNLAFDTNGTNPIFGWTKATACIYIGGGPQDAVLSIRGVKHEAYDDCHTIFVDSAQPPLTDITGVTRRLGPSNSVGDVVVFNLEPNHAVTLRNIGSQTQTASFQTRYLLNHIPLGFQIPAPTAFNTQAVPRKIPWYCGGEGWSWVRTLDQSYSITQWEPETQIFDVAFTANRTLTLFGPSGVRPGRKYTFIKKQAGAGSLIVGAGTPLATIPAADTGSVTVVHDGANWNLQTMHIN